MIRGSSLILEIDAVLHAENPLPRMFLVFRYLQGSIGYLARLSPDRGPDLAGVGG